MTAAILEWPEVRQHIGPTPPWVTSGRPCLITTTVMRYRAADGVEYTVPAGYVTDLASVPRLCWPVLPPHGELMTAAILHDWLYSHDGGRLGMTKARADALFQECAQVYTVTTWKRKVAYRAVRLGGRGGWEHGWHVWPHALEA